MVFSEARREECRRVTLLPEVQVTDGGDGALAKCRTNANVLCCDREKGLLEQ